MTTAISNPGLGAAGPGDGGGGGGRGIEILAVPPDLHLSAAARLIGESGGDPLTAAQRFLESASHLRVDLDLMWCTLDPKAPSELGIGLGPKVRQVCLAVIGSGRTAMLFVSGPEHKPRWPAARFRASSAASAEAHRERVALLHHACHAVSTLRSGDQPRLVLAQSLIESRELEAAAALRDAGFLKLGDLAYMRRQLPKSGPGRAVEQAAAHLQLPPGSRLASLTELAAEGLSQRQIDHWLALALERSYEGTLDCPELCGMRSIADVLDSHKSVGQFDPSLWWLLLDNDGPQGCTLLNVCPEQDSVELVYLGIAPAMRARALGPQLLAVALRRLYDLAIGAHALPDHPHIGGAGGITCAVDTRNTPAMKLYKRAGFERFGVRLPFVRAIAAPPGGA